jgi:hypothetical protein
MRIEPPSVDPVAPAAAGTSVSDYPGSPDATPSPEAPPAAEAAPEADPETVSRQPENTPIEPK